MTIVSRSFGIILCALALTACAPAGPTGFGPALGPYGYSEQKLESGAWKVSFTGNRQTERNAVETYALYRAAQITLKQGATRFMVIDRTYERETQRSYASRTPPSRYVGETDRHDAVRHPGDVEDSRLVATEQRTATLTILPFTETPPRPAFPIENAAEVITRLETIVRRRGGQK